MDISILYADLRVNPSKLVDSRISFRNSISAFELLSEALGQEIAHTVQNDLERNVLSLMVCWHNRLTGETCEIGGVGSLDWQIQDGMLLTITYDDGATTEEQELEFERWSLDQTEF